MTAEFWALLASIIISTIGVIVGGVWKLGLVRDDLKDAISENRLELERKIDNETDTIRHEFGETISALKEKVVQVELYIRDNYVSKQSFNIVLERILSELRTLSERFENRCTKMETEIKTYLHESRGRP